MGDYWDREAPPVPAGAVAAPEPQLPPDHDEFAPKKRPALQRVMQFEVTPKKVKRKELMHFSRQLAVFVRAGIPITDALTAICEETGNKFLRNVLVDVNDSLHAGLTFSGAMARHTEAFPPYYIGILRSAEATGHLDHALDQLSDYIDRDVESRRKVIAAMSYPAIVICMAIAVVLVLSYFALPKFVNFFKSLDAKLPLPTRMLISVANFMTQKWYVIAAIGGLLLCVGFFFQFTQRGRGIRDRLLLMAPLIGDLVRYAVLERVCRMLAAMLDAGVPLPEALAITITGIGNQVYKRGVAAARLAMLRGEGLAGPLAATGLFPTAARQMFRVGEDTGTLESQMETAGSYFERELEYKIKSVTTLLEPAVIIFVGLVVGFVAVALISAMYGIYRQVKV